MSDPKDLRENLKQKELINNPGANLRDSLNRGESGTLQDFTGGMSTKTLGIFILILIVAIIVGWLIL
ncbi:DUF6366 family protein [Macrococcoides canis]|uniref:DUF6366 family protein n=1 Tax=Macrococcoides canis TaxID=1855823 RepID=UPI00165D96BF|nr:DUF6366 family protein [Macrococcus canis]QNR08948.1 hypothetical protein GL258_12155 [Macrococcus canis]QTQ08085.1 hypothetical protein J9174_12085 [Macrococcus canis]